MSKVDKFEHMKDWEKWIGLRIVKHSGRPFKSSFKIGVPIAMVINQHSQKPAFMMEDSSVVDCHQCIPLEKNIYTGKAWKHHISEDFESGKCPLSGGAGMGGTIFTDYIEMIKYLREDGRRWHIAELNLEDEQIIFEFDNFYMATTTRNIPSDEGFKNIDLWS